MTGSARRGCPRAKLGHVRAPGRSRETSTGQAPDCDPEGQARVTAFVQGFRSEVGPMRGMVASTIVGVRAI
jgi:hypothetical protein